MWEQRELGAGHRAEPRDPNNLTDGEARDLATRPPSEPKDAVCSSRSGPHRLIRKPPGRLRAAAAGPYSPA